MATLNAGYWHTNYWLEDYWQTSNQYWPEFGVALPIPPPAPPTGTLSPGGRGRPMPPRARKMLLRGIIDEFREEEEAEIIEIIDLLDRIGD